MTDCLEKTTPYLYADDTEITSSSDNFDSLIENLNYDLNNIRNNLVPRLFPLCEGAEERPWSGLVM